MISGLKADGRCPTEWRDDPVSWWTMQDLNLRPLQCECSALTAELIVHEPAEYTFDWVTQSGSVEHVLPTVVQRT